MTGKSTPFIEAHILHLAIDKAACDLEFWGHDTGGKIGTEPFFPGLWKMGLCPYFPLEQIGTYLKTAFQRSS